MTLTTAAPSLDIGQTSTESPHHCRRPLLDLPAPPQGPVGHPHPSPAWFWSSSNTTWGTTFLLFLVSGPISCHFSFNFLWMPFPNYEYNKKIVVGPYILQNYVYEFQYCISESKFPSTISIIFYIWSAGSGSSRPVPSPTRTPVASPPASAPSSPSISNILSLFLAPPRPQKVVSRPKPVVQKRPQKPQVLEKQDTKTFAEMVLEFIRPVFISIIGKVKKVVCLVLTDK